jgi:hypothetical protein
MPHQLVRFPQVHSFWQASRFDSPYNLKCPPVVRGRQATGKHGLLGERTSLIEAVGQEHGKG